MAKARTSILLLSDSGEGKTFQIGQLAVWWFRKTGGFVKAGKAVGGQRTVLYSADFGGWKVVQPIVDLGILYVVDLSVLELPFQWLDKIGKGQVPVVDKGKIVWQAPPSEYTHAAYDSMTSMAKLTMLGLADKAAQNVNIGGGVGYKFTEGTGADLVTIASNNQTHYGIVQNAILRAVAESQRVIGFDLVTWTARLRRAEEDGMAPVLGPEIAGKALTPELPGWFTYAFRLSQEVVFGQPNKHVLYHEDHKDLTAPNSKILANGRVPVGALPLPAKQDPADVPAMLDLLEKAEVQSKAYLEKLLAPPASHKIADSL